MTLGLIFLIIAFVCFIISAANINTPPVNWLSVGLAFWVLALIVGQAIVK